MAIIKAGELDATLGLEQALDFADRSFVGLDPAAPVVTPAAQAADAEGRRIVDEARQQAAAVRERAKELLAQVETLREEERASGFAEGREAGAAEYAEALVALQREKETMWAEAEPQIIRMVAELAEKVLGRELARGAVVDVVRQAVDRALGRRLAVRLNSADLAMVRARETELTAALDPSRTLALLEDETVAAGGCIVESEAGTVDARIEVQLAAIKKALGLAQG